MHDHARPHATEVCRQLMHDEGIDAPVSIWMGLNWILAGSVNEAHVSFHTATLPRCTADCPGADWCFNAGLGEDPSGDNWSSRQKHGQAL